ncbi:MULTISPECIES: AAA family ATPase, partial [Erysipelotrichaceae]|uniref:AAA family ATPase n=1 Tax=Erysipelotrichaceae TaxID=128827 RepID=UPI002729963C
MYKIRKVKFKNHPVLQNLTLDFCDNKGHAVDTVILAGENGVGKSTIINELYKISSYQVYSPMVLELEDNQQIIELNYYIIGGNYNLIYVKDKMGINAHIGSVEFKDRYRFSGIYSDVDINFHARDISNVTSLTLDSKADSKRSSDNLPTQINQLLIDIQTMDDQALAYEYRKAKDSGQSVADIEFNQRMPRFTNAFNHMFESLSYNRVVNDNGNKTIIFKKYGKDVSINDLSSGEKQVVYRGCFLLQDINATEGAFVFIDEPEISLHPTWQMKVMDYYKGIFTKDGAQTSQIFAVTHSPFIIHNDNRLNDKVLVLSRDDKGDIVVKDSPLYFKCNSEEVVKDAFHIYGFNPDRITVYLEGPTDEKYFKKLDRLPSSVNGLSRINSA